MNIGEKLDSIFTTGGELLGGIGQLLELLDQFFLFFWDLIFNFDKWIQETVPNMMLWFWNNLLRPFVESLWSTLQSFPLTDLVQDIPVVGFVMTYFVDFFIDINAVGGLFFGVLAFTFTIQIGQSMIKLFNRITPFT